MKSPLSCRFLLNSLSKITRNTSTNKKYCSTSTVIRSLNDIEKEEVQIPVPWGHVSCVRWGPKNTQPIIALHGWQDNAGTWNSLIPHLPSDLSILALEYPGHGHSSWYPAGMTYHPIDNALIIKRTMNYFGWKSVSLLGHSMGAITSFVFSSLFPDEINFAILIDSLNPMTGRTKIESIAKDFNLFLKTDARNIEGTEPPSYTFDELVERLYIGTHKSVDKDKCKYLLERAILKSSTDPNKYYFKRDSRLKHQYQLKAQLEDVKSMVARITCPIMLVKYESAPYFQKKEVYMEIVELLKRSVKGFESYDLPGSHHGHLNNPEVIAPYIVNFLQQHVKK